MFRYMRLFTPLLKVWPDCRLQYAYTPASNDADAVELESRALKEYFVRFAQLPLLNRSMPKPYDDDAWNEIKKMVGD